jgi:hypothetical protein
MGEDRVGGWDFIFEYRTFAATPQFVLRRNRRESGYPFRSTCLATVRPLDPKPVREVQTSRLPQRMNQTRRLSAEKSLEDRENILHQKRLSQEGVHA